MSYYYRKGISFEKTFFWWNNINYDKGKNWIYWKYFSFLKNQTFNRVGGKCLLLTLLSTNPTNWSNTLKLFVGNLTTNCLCVFDHFVKSALKGLSIFEFTHLRFRWWWTCLLLKYLCLFWQQNKIKVMLLQWKSLIISVEKNLIIEIPCVLKSMVKPFHLDLKDENHKKAQANWQWV